VCVCACIYVYIYIYIYIYIYEPGTFVFRLQVRGLAVRYWLHRARLVALVRLRHHALVAPLLAAQAIHRPAALLDYAYIRQ